MTTEVTSTPDTDTIGEPIPPVYGPALPTVEDLQALLDDYFTATALYDLAGVLSSRVYKGYQQAHLNALAGTGTGTAVDEAWKTWLASSRQIDETYKGLTTSRAAWRSALDLYALKQRTRTRQ